MYLKLIELYLNENELKEKMIEKVCIMNYNVINFKIPLILVGKYAITTPGLTQDVILTYSNTY